MVLSVVYHKYFHIFVVGVAAVAAAALAVIEPHLEKLLSALQCVQPIIHQNTSSLSS